MPMPQVPPALAPLGCAYVKSDLVFPAMLPLLSSSLE